MSMDATITDENLDPASQQFVQGFRQANSDFEPDLAVDGLSESMLARVLGIFGFRKT